MAEKLTVENFGPIKKAEIDVTDMMVFIGPQSSGKSTLAKLITILNDFNFRQSYNVTFKEELEKTKTDLEASLNTFAKKDPTLKGDWDSKFPEYSREDPNVNLEEEADAVTEYLTRLPVEHSYELRLKAINEALGRIKRGTYGNCSSCEAKIPQKRLEAYPEADLCLKCKK